MYLGIGQVNPGVTDEARRELGATLQQYNGTKYNKDRLNRHPSLAPHFHVHFRYMTDSVQRYPCMTFSLRNSAH